LSRASSGVVERADKNDGHVGIQLPQIVQQAQAITIRQAIVEQHQIHRGVSERGAGLREALCPPDLDVGGEHLANQVRVEIVVLDQQDRRHVRRSI